ncbi:MAG: tetraacyldisaccharide 4'-kinase [Desulfuromonadales bacterium]|nr:tetraacyldisaccharide 4'-kinase [Desulfuromonadales bacterium]
MNELLVRWHRQISSSQKKTWWLRLLQLLLVPPSWCYSLLGQLRNWGFDRQIFASYRSSLPVVSVGNLAAGGTGKTPTVDWLVKGLSAMGKKPAIVSRGYGGRYRDQVGLVSDGNQLRMTAEQCGDEPLLLARRNPTCPLVVARRRADGVRYVEANTAADVIVLDDGFQHRQLARDVDLVLLDAKDPFGNGWTLPAGKLRESKSALKRADALLFTRTSEPLTLPIGGLPSYYSHHRLSANVTRLEGSCCDIGLIKNKKVFAFAGLADNQQFFQALGTLGVFPAGTLSLPDHVVYTTELQQSIFARATGCDILLTTEKDAVKLAGNMFELPCYYVGLDLDIANGQELLRLISSILWR